MRIALLQALHPGAVIRSLRACSHLLCKKPLSVNLPEARAVFEETRRHPGRIVMVNRNFRLRPHTRTLRKAVREGSVNRIRHIL